MRRTIKTPLTLCGTGLHSGARVCVRLHPSGDGMKIVSRGRVMNADWSNVRPSRLCTLLASPDDSSFTLSTVEHLMSALAATGITDVVIEVDGPEIPILDGSARPFFDAILEAGTETVSGRRKRLIITEVVTFADGAAVARLLPADRFTATFTIDFAHTAIGHQTFAYDPLTSDYEGEIATARTFCMEADVKAMRASGLALGGGMDNAVVFGEAGALNPGGLRFADEPVRHKLLDALGDLHLANAEIVGRFEGVRSGHLMTNMLLRATFASQAATVAA